MLRDSRHLEVIVLSARGLQSGPFKGCRRKVQLTLVCERDRTGEAFGAKVSPWIEGNGGSAQFIRFGKTGLQATFPLAVGRGGPDVAGDVRFADTAELQVRIFASQVPSNSSAYQAASMLLPTSVVSKVTSDLDRATAQLEAETKVPLVNLLAGRSGCAADRALGGWVPLQWARRDAGSAAPAATMTADDKPPPGVWLQMYVLPDHASVLPSLLSQLETEASQQEGLPAAQAFNRRSTNNSGSALASETSVLAGKAALEGPVADFANEIQADDLLGYSSPAVKAYAPSPAATAGDLIDICVDDSPTVAPTHTSNGVSETFAGGGLDLFSVSLPSSDATHTPLHDLMVSEPAPALVPVRSSVDVLGLIASSDASFDGLTVGGSSGPAGDSMKSTKSTAFGFIAANSPGGQIDLAALYGQQASDGSTPATTAASAAPAHTRFSALMTNSGEGLNKQSTTSSVVNQAKQATTTLQSMEQSLFADLTSSLRY
eukprot:TRINITY_DN24078_c0_g1_i1.p1 TRINITY_DN24078_c0_g1~~TRINITY_DN24078_c0_g1_i1.p1  ORF type:complete len:488 (+),score=85.72 TRINITY_DN24078_c0_g1_i1:114-1577(+)